jgi:FMN reductase
MALKILALCGSPRKNSNSQKLLRIALEGALDAGPAEVETYSLSRRHFDDRPGADPENRARDGQELVEKWLWAEAVLWASPVYTLSGPGITALALEYLAGALAGQERPDIPKVGGIIAQGSSRWGNQEIVLENMLGCFVSLGVWPVCADMPHSHIGVAGHIPDKQEPGDGERLLTDCRILGKRLAETGGLLRFAAGPPSGGKVLLIDADPQNRGIGGGILKSLEDPLRKIPGTEIRVFSFAGKRLAGCRHCAYCGRYLRCVYADDFEEFREKWTWADGVVWISPVGQLGPPAVVRGVLDRFSEIGFHTAWSKFLKGGPLVYPRGLKAVGAVVYGDKPYGGQEETLRYFINHAVLLDNFPLSGGGDYPLGAAVYARTPADWENHGGFRRAAENVAARVAAAAGLVSSAKLRGYDSIDEIYYASKIRSGAADKGEYGNGLQNREKVG